MLLEELSEGWNRYIKCVVAIVLLDSRDLRSGSYTSRLLEVSKVRFWLGINGINKRLERVVFGSVEESAFLEEERHIVLATSLVG